jgi:hypothetical protein
MCLEVFVSVTHNSCQKIYILSTDYILCICMCVPNGFGGLEVECWPLVPKFAGSDPAEAVGFLRAKKSSARLSSEGK